MVDYYMLSTRIWVTSWTEEPELYYYADTDKTLTLTLYDADGNAVKDNSGNTIQLTYNAEQGINNISLGDWLSAANKTWAEGTYIVGINNGSGEMYIPLMIVSTAMGIPVDYQDKIQKIIVQDMITNLILELPPTTTVIPASTRYRTIIYQHDNDKQSGRMVSYRGTSREFDTGWVKAAILKITYRFNTLQDMISWLSRMAYVRSPNTDTAKALGQIANTDPSRLANILSLYGVIPAINSRILDYTIDTDSLEITVKALVRLGFGWKDLQSILLKAAAVGIAAGSVAAGIGIALGTWGLGTAAGIGLIAAGITLAIELWKGSSSTEPTSTGTTLYDLHKDVEQTGQQGINNVTSQYNKALNDLSTLHDSGQISDTAYQTLKTDIDNMYSTTVTAIKEVVEEAGKDIDKAYSKGYSDGKASMYPWIAVSGGVGTALGYLLGKR